MLPKGSFKNYVTQTYSVLMFKSIASHNFWMIPKELLKNSEQMSRDLFRTLFRTQSKIMMKLFYENN